MFFNAKIQEIDGECVILFPDEVIKHYGLEEGDKVLVENIDCNHFLIGMCEKKK
jgi:bifunctional DNA-binding transcriptional regulator/antitoxin component of YhaV-PrlF toxin-antitoxin module